MGAKQFGARVQRLEDPALLTGKGRFVDDLAAPGTLEAMFVRSPHAHARIRSIDATAARDMSGVVAILLAQDLPEPARSQRMPTLVPQTGNPALRTQHALAIDEVSYVGQTVAVVIATNRYIAEDAAALVDVDYDVLPAISDLRAALLAEAPTAHADLPSNLATQISMGFGDVEAAFAGAPHVVERQLFLHRGGGMAMETRGVLAAHDPATDELTVTTSTQTPHIARRLLADQLDRDPERIRVVAPDVGGGFGPKALFYAEETVIAAAALILRRPVKWTEDRREHFVCATQERDQSWDVALAFDAAGKILGVRGRMQHDTGAFTPWGIIMPNVSAMCMPGPYVIPAYRLDVDVVLTNKVATAPVRGAGRPQAVLAMEQLMNDAACKLGLDPSEIRRRNFVQPEQMPYRMGLTFYDGKPMTYDSGDYPRTQVEALRLAGYETFRQRQTEARKHGRFIGIGMASYVEATGHGPYEGVTVRVLQTGKVAVATGAAGQGQGTRTTLAQIVADSVGCRIEDVVMTLGDTTGISNGIGAFASRQTANAGSSASMAGNVVRTQIVEMAARALGVAVDDIDIEDGRATAKSGNKPTLTFGEISRMAQGMPGFSFAQGQKAGLEHTAWFTPAQTTYSNGCHVVELEVDPETGHVTFLRYSVGHDCGTLVNPMIVDGQVQGAMAHGLGNALLELMKYDDAGQPLSMTLAEYLLPGAMEVPAAAITHVETPTPLNPLGVKGAGEGGTIPAPAAILAAIEDALSPFGIRCNEMPVSPQAIIAALKTAKQT